MRELALVFTGYFLTTPQLTKCLERARIKAVHVYDFEYEKSLICLRAGGQVCEWTWKSLWMRRYNAQQWIKHPLHLFVQGDFFLHVHTNFTITPDLVCCQLLAENSCSSLKTKGRWFQLLILLSDRCHTSSATDHFERHNQVLFPVWGNVWGSRCMPMHRKYGIFHHKPVLLYSPGLH